MNDLPQSQVSPREWLGRSIDAYQLSQCLYVTAKLGIPDLLKAGPKHYEELAQATQVDPNALFRLLRALASAGVFERLRNDQFGLNDLSKLLCEDVPGSMRAWAVLAGEQPYPAWGQLLYSIKTGAIAFDHIYGMSGWQYRSENPSADQVFNSAMSEMARASTAAILEAYDFSRFDRIVDVGGGQGSLITGILKANPSVRGVLFDLERVVEGARASLARAGIADRCESVAGSFLEGVPAGGDAYILQNIILDWDDAEATRILQNCRKAMQPDLTLVIVEVVIDEDQPTLAAAMADMRMMVMTGGHLRRREDFQSLLTRAGLAFSRMVATRGPFKIIEAKAA
jgi:O-methyltransferase/methyltransferase family protein